MNAITAGATLWLGGSLADSVAMTREKGLTERERYAL